MMKKRLFIRACPILSCYSFIVLLMYNIFSAFVCLFIFTVTPTFTNVDMNPCIGFWFCVLFCIRFFLVFLSSTDVFLYPWQHSSSQWAIPLQYMTWWSCEVLQPWSQTGHQHLRKQTEHITRISLLTSAMNGFSACFFLSAHLLQPLSPGEQVADNADTPRPNLLQTLPPMKE